MSSGSEKRQHHRFLARLDVKIVSGERVPPGVLLVTADIGVAPVPGSSFYSEPELGHRLIRFAFCKTDDMLVAAAERLARVGQSVSRTG